MNKERQEGKMFTSQSSGGSILKKLTTTIPSPARDTLERENIRSPQVLPSPQPAPNGVQTSPSPTSIEIKSVFFDEIASPGVKLI